MTHTIDRSQLQKIIAGLSEGVILIEPDQTITWANESALKMHGVEELAQLGTSVDEYRKNFVLRYRNNHLLGKRKYPAERVVAGETFVDVVVAVAPRASNDTEWVHQIRSLVITDTKGNPDCLVLVIADVTERYAAEARFERTFNANPAPAFICRLADQILVKVNQGFLDMLGYARDDVFGRSLAEVGLLNGVEKAETIQERLAEGRTIPQTEVQLPLRSGGSKLVILAGQPIEIGDDACMLFTFADLDARAKAESALRQSEERFAKSFQLSPVPTALLRMDGHTFLMVNEAFVAQFGHTSAELIGRSLGEMRLWARPEAQSQFEREIEQSGHVSKLEACLASKNGNELDCVVSAETVTIGDQICALATFLDITDRKRSERELVQAIEAVMTDASWLSKGILEKLAAFRRPGRSEDSKPAEQLSAREREVLVLISQGLSDAAIGKRLRRSPNTVRNHVASLYRKLGVHRRTDAVIWGRENGYIARK
ncbi:PAS domain S-box protein [Bradyrhizobium viridifuturi]|nr:MULTISPECIES: PAS domain S-box protein [Bradyrhizobium]ERF82131.1 MAG: PAS domain S-box protein [Bradyrhizobium sp. DFCI-1]OYU59512.1 MAG: helix-turn-helix transcriptional regulator [Bradyrhizobium sp. PARBB1]PSO24011.1 PAS domain S-box protein [Bradyrhizobium sp. MOS004]QRI69552.1 PAS domain S-box protein [Bradyrhizobium sp. PSBB068]MBR1022108.1 PAS domain S-box protein [Bradyrhizobium viridifuturi]